MRKVLVTITVALLTASAFSGGGGNNKKEPNDIGYPPDYYTTKEKDCEVFLHFIDANMLNQPPVFEGAQRPYNNMYQTSNSSNSLSRTDINNYYCQIKVTASGGYSKSYRWKSGSSMEIKVPSEKVFTITIDYYEPSSCSIYTEIGTKRVRYNYKGTNMSFRNNLFASLKYNGLY
ncbi:hypothetical protein [Carboxylicivirga sp. RSCT41]|uniref:hypothetical protein n=1 Tax=Carboxylicivirga agarovorans TaxID=3417570 RepID=UPI003D32EA95